MSIEPWHYETAADLDQTLVERLKNFPRQPDMLVYSARTAAALMLRSWLRLYHRFSIRGRENLPREGSFVLVANHTSHLDALCLLSALPLRQLHRAFPAAAQDYFFVSLPRLAIAAIVVNALPFNRQASARQSLRLCQASLENPGNVLVIFPEGTRSATGELDEFKPGIGMMLAGSKHPVIPCYLAGGYRAWPKGSYFPRPRKLQLTIGPPRDFSHLSPGKTSSVQIAGELHDAVKALTKKPPSSSTTST
jgi:1-acyl-sn-glycerol-3-phosphate acyltransferase